ncbi:uncharacterized protein [Diabrotica undecimpunctata]|uniref:uncharacterized protein n=1 Tax=Diabrotica undecimpunctata TaxID=50387 RepID=UPI003B633973
MLKLVVLFCAIVAVICQDDTTLPDETTLAPTRRPSVTCPPFDPSKPPVYVPDPIYCDIFYECSGSTPFQFHCAPGTNFNTETDRCDFGVDCGDRSTTIGTTTEETTPPSF